MRKEVGWIVIPLLVTTLQTSKWFFYLFDAFLKVLYITDNSNAAEGTKAMLPIFIG